MKNIDIIFQSKRNIPTEEELNSREYNLSKVSIDHNGSQELYLESGNRKVGFHNESYKIVFVWNIPPVVTCPGASQWCKRHCYNGSDDNTKYPINKWNNNLLLFYNNKELLKKSIINKLIIDNQKIAFRIHSSGDFFSVEYIEFWRDIISQAPNVDFWAYTRSWKIPALLSALNSLKELKNIQLFASVDDHTKPPPNWRKSFVYDPKSNQRPSNLICPEQSGKIENCISCKYCLKNISGDVYFILH